jgi:hypothetical protein
MIKENKSRKNLANLEFSDEFENILMGVMLDAEH